MTRVTLLLAKGPDKPEGDLHDRIVMNIALNPRGQLDVNAYHHAAEPWLAARDVDGRTPRNLEVIRIDEGWALQSTNSMDDPIWTFEGNIYRPGELVQLRRPNGDYLLYRIVSSERI